jgi:hypothetical protein
MKKSWRWIKRKKEELRKRDGDKCFVDYCMTGDEYRKKFGRDLDLHHIDEDPDNWDDNNLCLATHRCNVGETPRGKGKFHPERIEETQKALRIKNFRSLSTQVQIYEDELPRIRYAEFAKGYIADPLIDEELKRIFTLHKEVEKKELINALVNISKLSPERIKPRLEGWCNPFNGHLEEFEKDEVKFIRKKVNQ